MCQLRYKLIQELPAQTKHNSDFRTDDALWAKYIFLNKILAVLLTNDSCSQEIDVAKCFPHTFLAVIVLILITLRFRIL